MRFIKEQILLSCVLLCLTVVLFSISISKVISISILVVLFAVYQLIGYIRLKKYQGEEIRVETGEATALESQDQNSEAMLESVEDEISENDARLDEAVGVSDSLKGIAEDLIRECESFQTVDLGGVSADHDSLIEELKAGSDFINSNVGKAYEISDNLSKTAADAFELSRKVQEGIKSIANILSRSLEQSNNLIIESDKISKIVEMMSDIASKIHVLSINASIVSARAGTHGRSFVVIAKEIRNLADETYDSLGEINNLIGGIQETITEVVELTRNVNKETTGEIESLVSVAGALQGVVLAVEVIRTVSSSSKEKTVSQVEVIQRLAEILRGYVETFNEIKDQGEEFKRILEPMRQIQDVSNKLINMINSIR